MGIVVPSSPKDEHAISILPIGRIDACFRLTRRLTRSVRTSDQRPVSNARPSLVSSLLSANLYYSINAVLHIPLKIAGRYELVTPLIVKIYVRKLDTSKKSI